MSWRRGHLAIILADLDQQYARGDIDIVTWERERELATIDDNAQRQQLEDENS